jgi:hypothetical protein
MHTTRDLPRGSSPEEEDEEGGRAAPQPALVTGVKLLGRLPPSPPQAKGAHQLYPRVPGRRLWLMPPVGRSPPSSNAAGQWRAGEGSGPQRAVSPARPRPISEFASHRATLYSPGLTTEAALRAMHT